MMQATITTNVIGTIEFWHAGTMHDASYETAAWYRTFEYEAQTVEVRLVGNFATYTIQGRDTHEHFPTLFGGVATGGGRIGPCDQPSTYTVRLYDYVAAEMVEAGTLKLAEGFEIRESFFDHPVSCSGYVTDHSAPIGHKYSPCGCEVHEDAHYQPTKTERNERGFLPFGYVPGAKERKRHIKIVASEGGTV